MKLLEKKLIPIRVYAYCERCNEKMEREPYERAEHRYTYLYRCPKCQATEQSNFMYPYIIYEEEE